MPRAGFYEIRSTKIRFGRDGRWYADGEPIPNPRIARLFSRHLERKPDGSYQIELGIDRAPVEIEDTPFVVERVEGDPESGFLVQLNDGTREPLAMESLRVGAENVLYCRVKNGSEPARFLRPAFYQLAPHLEEPKPGRFALRSRGRPYPLERA
jgi:hypothetical protein